MPKTKRHYGLIFFIVFIILSSVGIFYLSQSSHHQVAQVYVAVRQNPDATLPLTDLINNDETIYIIEQRDGWSHVAYGDQKHGWVRTDVLDKKVAEREYGTPVFVSVADTAVYTAPDEQKKTAETLSLNSQYIRYYDKDGWSQIYIDGQLKWVKTVQLRLATDSTMHPDAKTANLESATIVTSKADNTPVRIGTNADNEILYQAAADEELYYVGTANNGYFEVKTLTGLNGFVLSSQVSAPINKMQRVGSGSLTLNGATIVIDAGHGGKDPGAIAGDVYEKEVTLQTATVLKKKLEEAGAKVVMVRETDVFVDLEDIVQLSNTSNADVFISLHYDASETGEVGTGTTTYFYHYADATLATLINNNLRDSLPLANRGAQFSDFMVTRENTQPAILLELGYMNNPQDVAAFNTDDYRDKVATSIVKALNEYFKIIQ